MAPARLLPAFVFLGPPSQPKVLGVGRCAFRPPRVVFVLGLLVSLINSLTSGKKELIPDYLVFFLQMRRLPGFAKIFPRSPVPPKKRTRLPGFAQNVAQITWCAKSGGTDYLGHFWP